MILVTEGKLDNGRQFNATVTHDVRVDEQGDPRVTVLDSAGMPHEPTRMAILGREDDRVTLVFPGAWVTVSASELVTAVLAVLVQSAKERVGPAYE